jgi:8-oxo-dGTP pyrophosphatase MutT (NUDIX family)
MMPDPQPTDPRLAVKEFLLAEYQNVAESFWKNEQTGETRVNWFIGIVTAGAGGLIGLASAQYRPRGEPLRLIYLAALSALLCFGVTTLFRIIKRNEKTDGYKKDARRIRKLFRKHFDDAGVLRKYRSFGGDESEDNLLRSFGGLTHTVSAINSMIIAGLAAVLVYPFGPSPDLQARQTRIWLTYAIAVIAFGFAAVEQYFWIKRAEAEAKKRVRDTTHAGGIVFKVEGNQVRYLLVGPSKEKKHAKEKWLLPKGRIEKGEAEWETALREVREETGFVGSLICTVGSDTFTRKKKKLKVKYFLLKAGSEVTREETRRRDWFTFEAATQALTYPGSLQLLYKAERKRRATEKDWV